MSVQVRIRELDLTEAIRAYVDRKLHASLGRFAGSLGDIQVTLTDVNGPRGGVDKACRISAELLPSRQKIVHETHDANIFAAIAHAIQKVRHTLRKALGRTKRWRRRRETIRRRRNGLEEDSMEEIGFIFPVTLQPGGAP